MLCASRSQWTDTVTLTHTVVLSRQLSAPQRHTHALTDSHTLTYSLINMYSQAHSHSSSYTHKHTHTVTLAHPHSLLYTFSQFSHTHSLSDTHMHTLTLTHTQACRVCRVLGPGESGTWPRLSVGAEAL